MLAWWPKETLYSPASKYVIIKSYTAIEASTAQYFVKYSLISIYLLPKPSFWSDFLKNGYRRVIVKPKISIELQPFDGKASEPLGS